jgi:hypothetical protein
VVLIARSGTITFTALYDPRSDDGPETSATMDGLVMDDGEEEPVHGRAERVLLVPVRARASRAALPVRAKRPVAQKGGPAAPLPRFVDGRVTQLAMGGDGVVQTELGDVFRAGVFPGERVRLKGLRRQGKLLLAGDAEVLEASAQRRAAPCVHAEACGGCAWMALAPEAQRDARRTLIERALTNARVTPLQPVELDPAGLEQDLGYRSRARMRFEGGVLGYRASG